MCLEMQAKSKPVSSTVYVTPAPHPARRVGCRRTPPHRVTCYNKTACKTCAYVILSSLNLLDRSRFVSRTSTVIPWNMSVQPAPVPEPAPPPPPPLPLPLPLPLPMALAPW